jgi:hypothetical protein
MPPRSAAPDISNDMILGELRGQVRELVHGVNNLSGKFDALTREVIALGPIAADIQKLKSDVEELKTAGNRQLGAVATITTILHSPVLLSIIMFAGIVWAMLTGRLKP